MTKNELEIYQKQAFYPIEYPKSQANGILFELSQFCSQHRIQLTQVSSSVNFDYSTFQIRFLVPDNVSIDHLNMLLEQLRNDGVNSSNFDLGSGTLMPRIKINAKMVALVIFDLEKIPLKYRQKEFSE